ncbi:MAG: hypothetical protein B6I20_11455 [Bacteroidetes bacterium 4572_117]|nr:MAG: hypothetical protein B6I20_11455 [Bacteroidetes bacterium 4572_117]
MLINLTNHPSKNWGEKQKTEAIKQYNEIVDIAFPQIEPSTTIEEVQELAEKYVGEIKKKLKFTDVQTFDHKTNVVHIMGEMTFTHNVIRLLGHNAINCIASTTKRTAVEEENGKKTSVFEFVQFRGYRSEFEIPF